MFPLQNKQARLKKIAIYRTQDLRSSRGRGEKNKNEGLKDRSHEKIISYDVSLRVAIHIVSFNREGRPVTIIDAE